MKILSFPAKAVSELVSYTINFSDMLQAGEGLNGVSCSATVYSGTDTNPSAIISGDATYTSTEVTQNITGGVAGNIYTVFVLATASNSHNYAKIFYVAVVADNGNI